MTKMGNGRDLVEMVCQVGLPTTPFETNYACSEQHKHKHRSHRPKGRGGCCLEGALLSWACQL